MSWQAVLTALVLPPFGLVLAALGLALLAWRGRRAAGVLAAVLLALLLILATPHVAGQLRASLERAADAAGGTTEPAAIIVLGADVVHDRAVLEVGPLTLERVRAGARLARETRLPILVTGGRISTRVETPLGEAMARSYREDFGLAVGWIEPSARNTQENARLSAARLRESGVTTAYLVTHAWHMPRAREAFARTGFAVVPVPVRLDPAPAGEVSDWIPQPATLHMSWLYLREWAGRLVYRLRDG